MFCRDSTTTIVSGVKDQPELLLQLPGFRDFKSYIRKNNQDLNRSNLFLIVVTP